MSVAPRLSLDLRGLLCPMPVVRMARAMRQIQVGEIVEAVATDPGVLSDIPAWARGSGHELVRMETEEGVFRFAVRRAR